MTDIPTLNRDALIKRNRYHIRRFLAHPFTLVGAILIAATSALNNVVYFVRMFSGLSKTIESVFDKFSQESESTGLRLDISFDTSFATLMLVIVLFLLFITALKGKKETAPGIPITALYVWSIISLISDIGSALAHILLPVLVALILNVIQAVAVTDILELWHLDNMPKRILAVIVVIVLITLIGTAAAYVLRGISRYRFCASMKNSFNTETLSAKGTIPYAVTNFFFAASTLTSSFILATDALMFDRYEIADTTELGRILSELPLDLLGVLGMFSGLLTAVLPVYMGIFALRYRGHIGRTPEDAPEETDAAPICDSDTPTSTPTDSTPQPQGTASNPYTDMMYVPVSYSAPEAEPKTPTAPKYCSQCGSGIIPNHNFCAHCGAPVNKPDHTQS